MTERRERVLVDDVEGEKGADEDEDEADDDDETCTRLILFENARISSPSGLTPKVEGQEQLPVVGSETTHLESSSTKNETCRYAASTSLGEDKLSVFETTPFRKRNRSSHHFNLPIKLKGRIEEGSPANDLAIAADVVEVDEDDSFDNVRFTKSEMMDGEVDFRTKKTFDEN